MQAFWSQLPDIFRLSLQASVLIILVLVVQRCLGRRLPPRWRYALWLLVLLRLALPWTISSPVSLFNIVKLPADVRHAKLEPAPARLPDPGAQPTALHSTRSTSAPSAPVHWLRWVWLGGALCVAGGSLISHYRIRRRVAWRRPLTDEPTLNLFEDCKALMAITTPVALIETEAVASPTLFGFVRPRVLLPVGLTRSFTPQELRHIFLHELAHIRRHDVFIGWLMLLLQAVHWFNPLVWLAFYQMRADRELACDALALQYADPGENEAYGLTIVKLLERFGQSVWAPSLAGILETKQQLKERIVMIAKFGRTNRGLALAVALIAALTLVTLTDAQNRANTPGRAPMQLAQQSTQTGAPGWSLQEKLDLANAGNQWAMYDLWDAYYRGKHGIKPDPAQADKWLGQLVQDLWVVRFEPVGDFTPANAGEFLARINKNSQCRSGRTQIGAASFFRTTQKGQKLIGSFLSNYPDQLKECLAKVPGVNLTSTERVTPEVFVQYERSPQESIWVLAQKIKAAEGGNQWALYDVWDAYYRGNHGVEKDPVLAEKWLGQLVQNVWVVRFEPVDDFAPRNPSEFLDRIHKHSSSRSGQNNFGAASFFRTTKQGDKLVGSFLSNYPDELKASLANVPGLKVTAAEQVTPQAFIQYEQSEQESL